MQSMNYGLSQTISGKDAVAYMAELIERNEAETIALDRTKQSVAILKQMNNRSRLELDAAKFELKRRQELQESTVVDGLLAEAYKAQAR